MRFSVIFFILLSLHLSACDTLPTPISTPSSAPPTITATPSPTPSPTTPGPITTPNNTPAPTPILEYYLGEEVPGVEPVIFRPGEVSTAAMELYFSIHPNLIEIYFTRMEGNQPTILVSKKVGPVWTSPQPASFSSEFKDAGPVISPDGSKLLFWSTRPLVPGTLVRDEFQLWMADREGNEWGTPIDLALPLVSQSGETDASITAEGVLYYMADYPDLGGFGLYRSEPADGVYQIPEKMDVLQNEDGRVEVEPFISPDERFLLFYAVGRPDNLTESGWVGDLYIAFKNDSGTWMAPLNLGAPINSTAEESAPFLSPDGRFLFFASNRNSPGSLPDIYWVSAEFISNNHPNP